jgi:predicted Zn finger-like uncharacterized protein
LFTQCAKCETVFRLPAEALRAAGGQVRCGHCGEVFNALTRLAEDASAFPAGESALEMETRADEILHSAVEPAVIEEPAVIDTAAPKEPEDLATADLGFARLEVFDLELYEDDRPATPAPPAPAPAPPAPVTPIAKPALATPAAKPAPAAPAAPAAPVAKAVPAAPAAKPAPPAHAPAPSAPAPPALPPAPAAEQDLLEESSLEFTLPPGELDRIFVESKPRAQPTAASANSGAAKTQTQSNAETSEFDTLEGVRGRVPGLEISEDVQREMLEGFQEAKLPQIESRRRSLPFAVWLGAAILLALLLSAQMIGANREWVAAHAPLRGLLHGAYTALGVALPAPTNLSSYQLRQWGVTGDPGANGTLRVRASILNTAAQLQPYPLLRVTLANRFGSRIGAREFEPAEYLGKPTVRMLAPGERADATLDILDPGKDAEGFEIDVCLRGIDQKISCAADAATQAKQ